MMEKPQWEEGEVAAHIVSVGREQGMMNVHAQLFFICQSVAQPLEWCCSQSLV